MPQACYFPLPSFFTGSPSLIAMGYPKREKKGRAKHSVSSPAWKRLKSLEGCRKNLCEHNKQQQPRKLNPKEKKREAMSLEKTLKTFEGKKNQLKLKCLKYLR